MAWRVAESLEVLLREINARAPRRSTVSDGSIGDTAHASRSSDHNPWVKDGALGVVTARDFTDDPGDGFDASDFAEWLRKRARSGAESRVKYIISDRRICSSSFSEADARHGRKAWEWWPYTGSNPHKQHVHVSVRSTKSAFDSEKPWGWATSSPAKPIPAQEDTMKPGDWDDHRLTAADARALGDPAREGQLNSWSALLRFPPSVARLRREQAAGFAALNSTIGLLARALGQAGTLTEAQITAAAEAGARAALAELGDALDGQA